MKKIAIILTFLIISGFGIILGIPIGILSENLSSYDIFNESLSFEYLPGTPSSVETLNLNVELGNIEIKYVDPPVNYYAKIDVYIEMAGAGLAGKDCFNYFIISEGNLTDSPIQFSMRLFPDISDIEVDSLIKEVSIVVNLKKGIIFDISVNVIDGNVDLNIPFNVCTKNLNVSTINGNILFSLTKCILDGNITITGNQSDIELRTWNVQYSRDCLWDLSNHEGIIKFNIFQSKESGANVTGFGESVNGIVHIVYTDETNAVGAWFKMIDYTLWICDENYPDEYDHDDWGFFFNDELDSGHEITSHDFPASSNYNISLYTQRDGRCAWLWNLNNIPE
ncbi:MAG: hypothetical protein ACFE8B_01200 [Candidatus Hermodarchaeota archaeon]